LDPSAAVKALVAGEVIYEDENGEFAMRSMTIEGCKRFATVGGSVLPFGI
jgi:hypothetical protein